MMENDEKVALHPGLELGEVDVFVPGIPSESIGLCCPSVRPSFMGGKIEEANP